MACLQNHDVHRIWRKAIKYATSFDLMDFQRFY